MPILFSKVFTKQYKKLPSLFQQQFDQRLKLFSVDRTDPALRIHPLKGRYAGYWSMSVNGDVRAVYLEEGNQIILFALIGTHSQLYG